MKAARVGLVARQLVDLLPLTAAGICLASAAFALYMLVGEDKADYVAHAVGLFGMAAVGVSAVVTISASVFVYLVVRRPQPPPSMTTETGAMRRTGFSVTSLRWWPLVQLHLSWETPSVTVDVSHRGSHLIESITPLQRGRYRAIVRRFRVYDIFGLSSLAFTRRYPADITVAPAKTKHHLSMALRAAGGDGYSHPDGTVDGELIDMRRYAPGDPGRLILWKAYARSRRLLVRTPERALSPTPTTVAFLIAGPGDEAAASTARTFIEEGLLGSDLVFAADGADSPAETQAEATEQIIDSIAHRQTGGQGLTHMSRALGQSHLANCVIFCPAINGPWVDLLAAFNRMLPAPATAIIGVDMAITAPAEKTTLARLLWRPSVPTDPVLSELPGLVELLRLQGIRVRLVHRATGQTVPVSQLQTLLGRGTVHSDPKAAA